MLPRWLPRLACAATLLLAPAAARADVAAPGTRVVPVEVVLTGLRDFPQYRFVIAVIPLRDDAGILDSLTREMPPPAAAREGEPVATSTIFFQEVRAIPADTPDPVTDAWLAASHAPTSGSVTRHPMRVPEGSGEQVIRSNYRVRQIQAGWVSLELSSVEARMADGSSHPLARPIPVSWQISAYQAPPGWKLFLMADPSWPRVDPPLPVVPCSVGDVLPSSPGPRTLVAVRGEPGPGGSLEGKSYQVWGSRVDAWRRKDVPPESPAVASRVQLEVEVEPGKDRLRISTSEHYQDRKGRWSWDADGQSPDDPSMIPSPWRIWALGGGGMAALLVGAWVIRRRLRAR